jgi:hypothetical protein
VIRESQDSQDYKDFQVKREKEDFLEEMALQE